MSKGGWSQFARAFLVSILVIYYSKTWRIKTINIYYLTVSVGQEARHGLARSLWLSFSHKAAGWECSLIWRLSWERMFPNSVVVIGRIQSSLSFCCIDLSVRQLTAWHLTSARVSKKRHPRWKPLPLCKLILEVTSYPFFCIPFPEASF